MEPGCLSEKEDLSNVTIVRIRVAPMLLEYGNSDGEDYSTCQTVFKAQVVFMEHNTQQPRTTEAQRIDILDLANCSGL